MLRYLWPIDYEPLLAFAKPCFRIESARVTLTRLILPVGLLLTTGCGRSEPTEPDPWQTISQFDITTAGGSTPVFSWPGGGGASLSVEELITETAGFATWEIAATGKAGFPSPVTYGTMPAAAYCGYGYDQCPTATPLVKGRGYAVFIIRSDGTYGARRFCP